MTLAQQVIALVTMAVAIMTILTVGTLAAADILPVGRGKAVNGGSRDPASTNAGRGEHEGPPVS